MKYLLVQWMIQCGFSFPFADYKIAQVVVDLEGNYGVVILHGWLSESGTFLSDQPLSFKVPENMKKV